MTNLSMLYSAAAPFGVAEQYGNTPKVPAEVLYAAGMPKIHLKIFISPNHTSGFQK